jgi:hypothetical protein
MDEEYLLQPQKNTFLTYFQKNKYMFFFGGVALLLLCIIFVIAIVANTNIKKPTIKPANKPTPSTTTSIVPTSQAGSFTREQTDIETQTKPQLDQKITVPYTISVVKPYGDSWAMIEVTNPDTDPANVVVEKKDGTWQVMLGPGTNFDESQLQAIGAPPDLIQQANQNL